MFKNILLSLDGSSYARSILEYGKYFSNNFDSYLNLLHAIDVRIYDWTISLGMDGFSTVIPSNSFQEESRNLLENKGEQILKKSGDFCEKNKLNYNLLKEYGMPAEIISDKSRISDLLIMGIRGEYGKWTNKFIGMVAEAVSRECPGPKLFVQNKFIPFTKILLAYDGSHFAARALNYAAFIGEKLNIPIVIASSHHDRVVAIELMKEAEAYLQPYKVLSEQEIRAGHPEKDIINIKTEKKCDLIIMGSYGHSRIREALIGSVTIQVLRNSDVPVLLMK